MAEVVGQILENVSPDERATLRIVLGSRFGELAATHTILASLTDGDGRVSPTAFSSSVHNASLGLVSIAQQIQTGTVAMSGGPATAYLCLVEAAGLLREGDAPVIVVLADEAPREELGQPGRFPLAAIALLLKRAQPSRTPSVTTCWVVPRAHASATAATGVADDDAAASIRSQAALADEHPAWWPLRAGLAAPRDEGRVDGSGANLGRPRLAPLIAEEVVLPTGLAGEQQAVLRVLGSDEHTALVAAYDAMPHESPARVVGFPAWSIGDGLVCTVSPRRGDPFVALRQAVKNTGQHPRYVEEASADPTGELTPSRELTVDAIACLEWIAQAAAWCGALSRVTEDLTEDRATSSVAHGGALLATRRFRLVQRWLSPGETYRVVVRRVAGSEGLARYDGTVYDERGRVVASGDILVRSSSR